MPDLVVYEATGAANMLISDMDASLALVSTKPVWHIRCRREGASTPSIEAPGRRCAFEGLLPSRSLRLERFVRWALEMAVCRQSSLIV